MLKLVVRLAILSAVAATSAVAMTPGGAAPQRAGALKALSAVEKGKWELRERGVKAPPRYVCVRDPAQLLQVQHPEATCRRYVVTDAANRSIVTYQCTDHGAGRSDLRVETSRLVQIDAQGVSNGAPFSMSIEARRVGDCE